MVLADLGRRITKALHTLSNATVINEDVSCFYTCAFTRNVQCPFRVQCTMYMDKISIDRFFSKAFDILFVLGDEFSVSHWTNIARSVPSFLQLQ